MRVLVGDRGVRVLVAVRLARWHPGLNVDIQYEFSSLTSAITRTSTTMTAMISLLLLLLLFRISQDLPRL